MKSLSIILLMFFMMINIKESFAGYFMPLKGTIKGAIVKYNDSDTVTITTGYGECNGNYWEISSPVNHDMASLASGADFHYIYIDNDASSYPNPTIIDSTTEPSWSDSKQGWYNGDDRCIGLIWSPNDSATVYQFAVIDCGNNVEIKSKNMALLADYVTGSTSWQTLSSSSDYLPVNAVGAYVSGYADHSGSAVEIEISSDEYRTDRGDYFIAGYSCVNSSNWVSLEDSRDLAWKVGSGDSNVYILLHGYKYQR